MSLKKRIQVLLAFLVGVPLILLLFESYRTGRHTLLTQMKEESLQIAQLETAEIDLIFAPARIVVEGLVRAIASSPEMSERSIRELLSKTVQHTPEISAAAIVLDPELTTLGHYAHSFIRHGGVVKVHPMEGAFDVVANRDWYQLPMKSGRGHWTTPRPNERFGTTLVVTCSAPIRRNDDLVGVVAVELHLDDLVERLRQVQPGWGGVVYFVNNQGEVVAHPLFKELIQGKQTVNLENLTVLMKRQGVDTVEMVDPVSKVKSWVVEAPIRELSQSRGGQDWSLIVSWPLDTRLVPLGSMGKRMLVLYAFLGGTSFLFLNRSFDHIITRPLRRLTQQASDYAHGKFESPMVGAVEPRELRELAQALDRLGESLSNHSTPKQSEKERTA